MCRDIRDSHRLDLTLGPSDRLTSDLDERTGGGERLLSSCEDIGIR